VRVSVCMRACVYMFSESSNKVLLLHTN